MVDAFTLSASLTIALGCLIVMSAGGIRNGLLVVAAFFVLFAYGPAINLVTGAPFFFGIYLPTTGAAVTGFALAMVGLAAAHVALPQRLDGRAPFSAHDYLLLPWLLGVSATYGVYVLATRGPRLSTLEKLDAIAVAGPLHYQYLLLQILAVSTAFLCRTRLSRTLWWGNLATYVLYSTVTSERDFIFVLAVLLIHREIRLDKRRSLQAVALGFLAVLLATALAASRAAANTTSLVTNVLNQGSILFIDSHLQRLVPETVPYREGQTYVEAVLRLVGLNDSAPLPEWFVSLYAPGSPSGYGFSLTGEAYLNFGYWAIPLVFLVLGLVQRHLMNGATTSDVRCYLSVVYLVTLLYALRGDLAQVLNVMVYASVLFVLLRLSRVDIRKVSKDAALLEELRRAEQSAHAPSVQGLGAREPAIPR